MQQSTSTTKVKATSRPSTSFLRRRTIKEKLSNMSHKEKTINLLTQASQPSATVLHKSKNQELVCGTTLSLLPQGRWLRKTQGELRAKNSKKIIGKETTERK